MTKFRFASEEQIARDLFYLAAHSEKVQQIAELVSKVKPTATFTAIKKQVEAELKDTSVDVERVLDIFQNLLRAQARTRADAQQLIDNFLELCAEYSPTETEDSIPGLDAVREVLSKAIGALPPNNPLNIARKAERLLYSYQNTLSDVRIITDMRPVFDQAGDQIFQAVVTHALLLDYTEAGVPHRIEIALDATDLADLRIACERVERKAVAIKDTLKDQSWPTRFSLDET